MRKLVGNTSGMALGTLISRLSGVIRDIILVAAIGTGIFSDTYSVANSIPNIVFILIAGGAINAVFIPSLIRHMQDDEDQGKRFTDQLLSAISTILIVIVGVTMLAASLLVRLYSTSQWSSQDLQVATVFAWWCLPQIFFYGMYTVISQILNSRDVFVMPMFAPIMNNIIVITTALVFISISTGQPTTQNVSSLQLTLLGAGTTLGVALQASVLLPALKKSGYWFTPRLSLRGSGLGKVGDLAAWTLGFVAVNQLSFLIIARLTTYANVVASREGLVEVGFTSYQKGQLMMMLPHSIITVSLITALLPRLSKQSHSGDLHAFGHDLTEGIRIVIAFIVPSAVLLCIAGPQIGRLLYGYGASSVDQGSSVGLIASLFALGLPAFSVFYVLLRSYYAQENTKTPFLLNLGFNILHLSIGLLLFNFVAPSFKVASLAVAYSIAYTITAIVTWSRVRRRYDETKSTNLTKHLIRVVLCSIVAGLVGSFGHLMILQISTQASIFAFVQRSGFVFGLIELTVEALLFATVYLVLARRLKIRELDAIQEFLNRRLRR
jgi:putative peptidoglycan lipid II flippase